MKQDNTSRKVKVKMSVSFVSQDASRTIMYSKKPQEKLEEAIETRTEKLEFTSYTSCIRTTRVAQCQVGYDLDRILNAAQCTGCTWVTSKTRLKSTQQYIGNNIKMIYLSKKPQDTPKYYNLQRLCTTRHIKISPEAR